MRKRFGMVCLHAGREYGGVFMAATIQINLGDFYGAAPCTVAGSKIGAAKHRNTASREIKSGSM